MRRSTLVLIIVLVVALLGAGVFFWMNQDQVTNLLNTAPQNTNTVIVNTNTAPNVNLSAPTLIDGDQDLTGTLKVEGVTMTMTGVTKTKTFEEVPAAAGKTFVIVYFMPVTPNEVLTVKRGLQSSSRLTSGTTVYDLAGYKIASTSIANDRGYLKFVTAESATNLQLEVGSGADIQKIVLP